AGMAAREVAFYFGPYAASDRWAHTRTEGGEIAREGRDAWALSLAGQQHMANSGWVYHLAPEAFRGGVLTPGAALPLAFPPNRDLAFLLYPGQAAYLPYLEALYPGGAIRRVTEPDGAPVFTVYRVPREVWASGQGALARTGGRVLRVARLGDAPAGTAPGASVRWTASLRIRRFWNYAFRTGPGPVRLAVDGIEVLRTGAGTQAGEAAVHLARGDHFVEFTAAVPADGAEATLLLGPYESPESPPRHFERPAASALTPRDTPAGGLFGRVTAEDGTTQERRDGAVATGSFSDEAGLGDRAYRVVWTGSFLAGTDGVYGMGLFSQGDSALSLDGRLVVRGAGTEPSQPATSEVTLERGAHRVEITFEKAVSPGGIEWTFTPPGGPTSIVPPTVLEMPLGAGVGPPLPARAFGPDGRQRPDKAVSIRW
ncbi:MAG: PA14 domain-containing protein, partial [Thermoanaerobaculia bacterium]